MIIADRSALFTTTVVVAGVSIVIGVLLLLILVFYLFGLIMTASEKKAKSKSQKSQTSEKANNVPAVKLSSAPASVPKPSVEEGISGEVVAAIAAAVATVEGPGAVVTSVRAIKKNNVGGRNPWATAAVVDNNRPF